MADRLGRYTDTGARLDGVPLAALTAAVRGRTGRGQRRAPVRRPARDELSGFAPATTSGPGGAAHGRGRGHRRRAAGRSRHLRRRARAGVLRRPTAAAAAGPRAVPIHRSAAAGRADQRGRRAHRGAHRRAARDGPPGPHHGRVHDQSADAGPGRPGRLCAGRPGRGRGYAPGAAGHRARLRGDRDPRGGRVNALPVADAAEVRRYARAAAPASPGAADRARPARAGRGRRAVHALAARQAGRSVQHGTTTATWTGWRWPSRCSWWCSRS